MRTRTTLLLFGAAAATGAAAVGATTAMLLGTRVDDRLHRGYVAMAIEELGLPPEKVDTIADFEAVKRFGVQSKGGADAATAAVLAELADLIAELAASRGLGPATVEAPPVRGDAPLPYRVNVERLAAAGYRPAIPLDTALSDTLSFCSEHRHRLCEKV